MLGRRANYAEDLIEELVRNVFMKKVAHRIHEVDRRFHARQRLAETARMQGELKTRVVPPGAHGLETTRHHFGVAMLAAWGDFRATRRRVPSLLSPLDS